MRPAPGWRGRVLSARRLPANRTADQNARFRIVVSYSRSGRAVDIYRDLVLLKNGRGIGLLSTYSWGKPCICTKTLGTILAGRMIRAHL